MGLNSKEIAEIMNILPSSVFVNRSRLRKKLNLPADTDLTSYFMSLNSD
ncbi:MAG: helix-turn-helix transcriptional regulator [Flavobacteriales bacterium]